MKYPMFKVHIDVDNALKKIKEVLDSGFVNEGVQVTELHNKMSEYLNHKNVLALNSCTSAITLALKLSGVGPGDEVITTSMTCVASNTPIHNLGAKVVWADIDKSTGNIDPNKVLLKITNKTKAVLCVNWAGLPCELENLQKICKNAGIKLIQDAAHGFGAEINGRHVCHFSDFTCYSMQAIKHINSGDGGLLVCNNIDDFNKAKKLKWFGIDREATKDENGEWKGQRWNVDVVEAGYKFHMNNITASIALSQIPHIERIISIHRNNAKKYIELLTSDLIQPMQIINNSNPSYWVFTCLLDNRIDRDALILRLKEFGIDAGLVHTPNHHYTCFKESLCSLDETEYFSQHQISLPCGWWLSEKDVIFISNTILQEIEEQLCVIKEGFYSLRYVGEKDHNWLVELHNDITVLRNITNSNPITLNEHITWWNSLNTNKEKRFIFYFNNIKIGFAKFYSIDYTNRNCYLGGDIHIQHRGKGHSIHMWKLMLNYCFNTLKLQRIAITVAEYNNIALKTYKKVGFVEEGKLKESLFRDDKYYNQLCMYMTKDMYDELSE